MSTIETLAAKLAEDTMKAMQETGNDRLYVEVGNVLAASSQTLEEAYLTEIRVRLSEITARRYLENAVRQARAKAKRTQAAMPGTPPAAPAPQSKPRSDG